MDLPLAVCLEVPRPRILPNNKDILRTALTAALHSLHRRLPRLYVTFMVTSNLLNTRSTRVIGT